ncbi:MAG TPA: Nif11-like leader peptide family RiPP precursor [Candidatus Fimadaptatus faecigallinarum]|uniref:Nif11-like leader peptide family RiPP n=1 Tax=Candidatus Fimadaptatus faecigallinarum TaxID=2840814 RepID=A0A9D1LPZ1_9FIRM|nr:Nif11-like leader peptide family RiPP precursor [Candidatus Fimadaptatus faecigallinarum]
MTDNMKAFLEMIARDAGLAERAVAMSADELRELARTMGMQLTDGDFEQGADEVSDDELTAVAGGYCSMAGGNSCTCSEAGYGKSSKRKFCLCLQGGTGKTITGTQLCQCSAFGSGGSD